MDDGYFTILEMLKEQCDFQSDFYMRMSELIREHNRLNRKNWYSESQLGFVIKHNLKDFFDNKTTFYQDCLDNYETTKRIEHVFNNIFNVAFDFDKKEKESDIDYLKCILQDIITLSRIHNERIKRILEKN